ncbi:MAG: ABC transporter permease [Lachnospiraceae bacterium]|nr:ABC transporter permease [Lachnospiraceae bacterium]
MEQKLSAMRYVKNNKRRVAVLVVSLSLCFMLTYLVNFLLSSTEETFRIMLVDNTEKIQYVRLAGSSLGIDVEHVEQEELHQLYLEKNLELTEKLKGYEAVSEAFYAQILYNEVKAAIGEWQGEIPLVEKEQVPIILEHYGTKVCEGRMPEHPGEIVLDRASMKNGDYELNDYFDMESLDDTVKIVGILDCDSYFGCGIPSEEYQLSTSIVILSDGSIQDITTLLEQEGIFVREGFDTVVDAKVGKEDLQKNVIDVIGKSESVIYIGVMLLLSLSLYIVYTMYLRDRRNEWCLYCSIGYSKKEIYRSILRELFFTFGLAVVIGAGLTMMLVVGLDFGMIRPMGIRCRYFYPETILEILCAYMLLIGLLQIPIRYALYKIRTIDAMEDDLYV